MSGDIFLNIDTIVLRGLQQIDRHALAEALQHALKEQLVPHQTFTAADLSRVRTSITLPGDCGSEQLGQHLARHLGSIVTNNSATTSSTHKKIQGGRHDT